MKLLIVVSCVLSMVLAAPGGNYGSEGSSGGYGAESAEGSVRAEGEAAGGGAGLGLDRGDGIRGANAAESACREGLVRHVDGSCVQPVVSNKVFVFSSPSRVVSRNEGPAPSLPDLKVENNIVFIRTPEQEASAGPIVVPPPQQKTQVYVLAKKQEGGGQQVIEVPAGPAQSPEVYFVNYSEGENPQLPGGVDLQTALSGAAQSAQVFAGTEGADSGIGLGLAADFASGSSLEGGLGSASDFGSADGSSSGFDDTSSGSLDFSSGSADDFTRSESGSSY